MYMYMGTSKAVSYQVPKLLHCQLQQFRIGTMPIPTFYNLYYSAVSSCNGQPRMFRL